MNNKQKKIPNGWNEVRVKEIVKFSSGDTKPKNSQPMSNNHFKVPVYGGNGIMSYTNKINSNHPVIIIGRVGEYCGITRLITTPCWITDNALYSKKIAPQVNIEYFSKRLFFQKLGRYRNKGGQPLINQSSIGAISLPLPPLYEQKQITKVLETWDTYLENLNKTIKLKKNVKKGLMQQLLTGNVRLKEFNGKWKEFKIDEFCDISRGGSPRPIKKYLTKDSEGISWLRIGDININGKYVLTTKDKIIKKGLSKTTVVYPGDFILSNSMSFGRPYIMKIRAAIHDGWLTLKNIDDRVHSDYLYYLLLSNRTQAIFASLSAGSGVQNLKKDTVRKIVLSFPPLKEQTAIAKILTTSDKEIEALEKKRNLILEQKKFLLNNLITGNIRLPEFRK